MTLRSAFAAAAGGLLLGTTASGPQAVTATDQGAESFYPSWAVSAPFNTPLLVRDTDGALGRLSLQAKRLTLEDVARVHGHLCDGLAIAWVALGAGLRSLFPDGVVDRTDVKAVSKNGPCWADAAAWTTGTRLNHGTLGGLMRIRIILVRQRIILTQKEAQMKLYSSFVISCVLCFSSLQAIPTAYAQDQAGAGGPDKIKAVLLRPTGWKADFGHGQSEHIYEARGEKVVAKIQGLSRSDGRNLLDCERDVTITSDSIKHDGCRDREITLVSSILRIRTIHLKARASSAMNIGLRQNSCLTSAPADRQ